MTERKNQQRERESKLLSLLYLSSFTNTVFLLHSYEELENTVVFFLLHFVPFGVQINFEN